ncbi:glycerol-3-phosphate 1-O-acyltransferase PlsY [Limobrevibacterium gyesilva]|uniref:Glycerol-3-phosphate acyltransferase n=1 Tax=Limobrevibacterium gyesilva TaxID=2991712 RepID=A0AA42CIA9_9PROT|nr:glycerol-3-phosphate 1-O-acyltransferase PlsY [Limobrevibacterium gyesilva]MCW3475700.1 glycerol-3-phosphate 1-O-acyltransferase PlsY [Limobrevibacterium gyesilva]
MDLSTSLVLVAAAAYLIGAIPFGLLLTRAAGLGDIRKVGSGNIGATNVLRTGRKGLAAATVLLDGAKGAAAVLLGQAIAGVPGVFVAGLAAVIGHLFPVWLRFRGGKGVATGFGVLIAASPLVGLLSGAVWIATAAVTRISSASALAAFAAAPILAFALHAQQPVLGLALAVAAMVYLRHRTNIERLISGTEPRIGAGK